jgi:hypothetical protein
VNDKEQKMNERIRALAKEAEDYAEGIVTQLETVRGGEFHEAYTKKFAELIIRECADIADGLLEDNTGSEVMFRIKEHFGVDN